LLFGGGAWIAAYARRSDAVTDQVQSHFLACGIQTLKRGTDPGTGKRAVVEVGFHSLRHTFVSLCREANAPLAVVEAIVGHANPAMTRHYTHVGQAAAGATVAALPDITGVALPAAPEEQTIPVSTERLRALAEIKTRIRSAQVKAAMSANREMILLYWDIGRMIAERQKREGWGAAVIPRSPATSATNCRR